MHKGILLFALGLKILQIAEAQNESYWQQHVDYEIQVSLDDQNHRISGNVVMQYTNHSPQELTEIWMHLWANAYDNPHTALGEQFLDDKSRKMLLADEEDLGRMEGIAFTVNGQSASWSLHPDYIDIALLQLPTPLGPGQTIEIATPFSAKIPSSDFSRFGHADQSYQITQWYPKPAVLDAKGWHEMPYLNQGEFYSEFGNFEVFITLPSNYIVGASGDLQNPEEKAFLMAKAEATASLKSFVDDQSFPPSSEATKTLHYLLENAHDFAWFADKRFHVLHGEVLLPFSQRKVETWSYFTNFQPALWMESVQYINRAVMAYSNYVGEYQWNVAQAVEGALSAGAGMEYPTITVIGESPNGAALDNVITHEVGHNWFYGMLGSNERDYAWMDEGVNSYYESRYMETYYNNNPLEVFLGPAANFFDSPEITEKSTLDLAWYLIGGLESMNKAQAIQQHSNNFTQLNYGLLVYMKTAYLMRYMADFLGQGQFDRVMAKYFDEWKMKHPQPEDIRRVFEEETGENMAWFFDGLLQEDRSLDYRLKEVNSSETTLAIRVQNKGDIAGPFPISVMNGDSIVRTEWHRGFVGTQTVYMKKLSSKEQINQLRIGASGTLPDYNLENNTMRTSGLFKKIEPLSLKPLIGIDNPHKTSIYYLPLPAFNVNDGFMLGLGVWNSAFPTPKVEWLAAPLYSFQAKTVVGQGSLGLNLYPQEGPFNRVRLSVFGATYHIDSTVSSAYSKIQPRIDLDFRKKQPKDPIQHSLHYRNVRIGESYDIEVGDDGEMYSLDTTSWYNELQYVLSNKNVRFNSSIRLTVQQGPGLAKLFTELNAIVPVRKFKVETRVFAGWMQYDEEDPYTRFAYSLSGVSSYNDYLYDDILPGRNAIDGMWSNQITRRDGFLKLPAAQIEDAMSNTYLLALNMELHVPNIPLALFADAAYAPGHSINGANVQYDAGVMIPLLNNYFEVYFPLLASDGLIDPFDAYGKSISFIINLNGFNPFDKLRRLEL